MKVFLSWSGNLSRKVACVFRDWLPSVVQSVKPYVSAEDIDKGTRWSTDIAKELEESSYGIICVTKDNVEAPWVNFEAGALSKTIDKSKVCPFLFNIKRSELQGPLLQFQSTIYDRDDISKLLFGINKNLSKEEKLEDGRLKKVFEVWWPELKTHLDNLQKLVPEKAGKQKKDTALPSADILEELLLLVRNQQKLLRSPESLFPPDYLLHIFKRFKQPAFVSSDREELMKAIDFLSMRYKEVRNTLSELKGIKDAGSVFSNPVFPKLFKQLKGLEDVIAFLHQHFTSRNLRIDNQENIF